MGYSLVCCQVFLHMELVFFGASILSNERHKHEANVGQYRTGQGH